jgi:hypothetical protein
MRMLTSLRNWIRTHKKLILVNSLIWIAFGIYALFLAEPLFSRFEAIPGESQVVQMQLPEESNKLHYGLDLVTASKGALEIQGWAFIDGSSTTGNHTYIVLKSSNNSYLFDSSVLWSNPINELYGSPDLNLDWAGFTTSIPLRKIENGDYTIGVCIVKNDESALQYSNKTVSKSNNGVKVIH